MQDPGEVHLQAVYQVLLSLKGTIDQGVLFSHGGNKLVETYTERDYAGSITD